MGDFVVILSQFTNMKEVTQYIVDAFTDKLFSGNQAAVCLPAGSVHCMVAPYWASRLGKNSIIAYQASKRNDFIGVCLFQLGRGYHLRREELSDCVRDGVEHTFTDVVVANVHGDFSQ